jgi:hypothetical protein
MKAFSRIRARITIYCGISEREEKFVGSLILVTWVGHPRWQIARSIGILTSTENIQ